MKLEVSPHRKRVSTRITQQGGGNKHANPNRTRCAVEGSACLVEMLKPIFAVSWRKSSVTSPPPMNSVGAVWLRTRSGLNCRGISHCSLEDIKLTFFRNSSRFPDGTVTPSQSCQDESKGWLEGYWNSRRFGVGQGGRGHGRKSHAHTHSVSGDVNCFVLVFFWKRAVGPWERVSQC